MTECVIALAIMTYGMLGVTELSVQRLQHIRTASQLNMLIGITRDAAVLVNAGATTTENLTDYSQNIKPDSKGDLSHIIVSTHTSGDSYSITLPVYITGSAF